MTPETTPFLGVCMIVKDASKTIGALMDSIVGHVDEIVIVDTGSTDDTRERIAHAFVGPGAEAAGFKWPAVGEAPWVGYHGLVPRIVLASFKWVDDFAAARNFSFSLSTAKWRGYFDADDVFPRAKELRARIEATEKNSPKTNCIVLPYDYAGGEMVQDKFRFVRWEDGWKWRDEIHEYLVREPAAPRVISRYGDLEVLHQHSDEHTMASLTRNIRICNAVYEKAKARGDVRHAATMAFYIGEYAEALKQHDLAIHSFMEAQAVLGEANLATIARAHLARTFLAMKNESEALAWAALAIARDPENPLGHAMLALTRVQMDNLDFAAHAFDAIQKLKPAPLDSARDALLLDGTVNVQAAKVYAKLGRVLDAQVALNRLPAAMRMHVSIAADFTEAVRRIQEAAAFDTFRNAWETLVCNDEPYKARALFDCVPQFIADLPGVAALKRLTDHRLRHIDGGWQAYLKCYAELTAWTYEPRRHDVEQIRGFYRAKATREWAASLDKVGPPISMLVIGPQDCNMERDILTASERIQMTCCDVSPLAEGSIAELVKDFPGRVTHAQMKEHNDWPLGPFDVIMVFEVLEHVPDDVEMLRELNRRLKDFGTLFLSTPVSGYWHNHTLSKPKDQTLYDWWGHVRSNSPKSLWEKFRATGFDGRLVASEVGAVFFAKMNPAPPSIASGKKISIFVPGTPHPFDPDSVLKGHLGGSEEAVIFLSESLAHIGYEVTVYSPRPKKTTDEVTIHAQNGVLWRAVEEFDALGDHQNVLFWRCPHMMLDAQVREAKYQKLLWLHDTHYRAPVEAYKAADKVIVLSKAHAAAVRDGDGYTGPFHFATNGIDLYHYPPLGRDDAPVRDRHKVVYGSSPDRGLDRLIKAWPLIRAAVPKATLDIYYTWDLLESAMRQDPALAAKYGDLRAACEALADEGVTVKGGVDHLTLARAYRTANVWAYPTTFYEISCITAMKAQAAGCWPVVNAAGALNETLDGKTRPYFFEGDTSEKAGLHDFAADVITHLISPPPDSARAVMSDRAREVFSWGAAAERFDRIIRGE